MNKFIALVCLGFVYAVSIPAFAGAQQDKKKDCSAEAKGMKGEERKTFMNQCKNTDPALKSASSSAAPEKTSKKDKKNSCKADAKTKELKGAERKAFVSSCLKA